MNSQPHRDRGRSPRHPSPLCPPRSRRCGTVGASPPSAPRSHPARRRACLPASPSGSLATQRLLRLEGFSEAEATNLTAYLVGLHPTGRGWTLRELSRLLFLRWLVDCRRLDSQDERYAGLPGARDPLRAGRRQMEHRRLACSTTEATGSG